MSGAAGGTFGGLEELVKLVKLGIGQKVLGIWNGAFDKNYNVHLARTVPLRSSRGGGSRTAHSARPQLLRTFACSPVMVADCWSIVATFLVMYVYDRAPRTKKVRTTEVDSGGKNI